MFNLRHICIFLLLLDTFLLIQMRSIDQQRLFQILKQQRSADNDNEYVWFTRNIHRDMFDDPDGNELVDRSNLRPNDFFPEFGPNDHEHRNGD